MGQGRSAVTAGPTGICLTLGDLSQQLEAGESEHPSDVMPARHPGPSGVVAVLGNLLQRGF